MENDKKKTLKKGLGKIMKYLRIGLQLLAYLIVTYPQNKSHYHIENMLVTVSHSPR